MKTLHKQCIALLLALMMIFSLGAMPAMADDVTAETTAEATVSAIDTALAAKWAAFGVTPADVKVSDVVTRGAAAKALADALGVSKVTAAHDITDVNSDIAGAARACRDLGFFEVVDGKFRPDDAVTVSEALRLMAVLVGYPADLVTHGASLALQSRLSKGLDVSFGSECTWSNFLRLLDNAAEEEIVRVIGFTNGKAFAAEPVKGATFLSEYLRIYSIKGVVDATPVTAIDGGNTTKAGYVRIESVSYADKAGVAAKIGYEVKVWYKEDNRGNRTAIFTEPAYKDEEFISIVAEDILPATTADVITYKYEEDDKEEIETMTLTGATFIYNGCVLEDPEDADLKPVIGKVELVDQNDDGRADVVFISNMDVYVVGEISAEGMYIIDAYDASKILMIGEDAEVTITKKGVALPFGDIIPGNVVYAGASKDGKMLVLDVYALQTTGVLTGYDDENIYIDGVAFKVSAVNRDRIFGLSLGAEYVFYEGMGSEILGYTERIESEEYAYLIAARLSDAIMAGDEYGMIRIFTKSGGLKTIATAKKVSVTTGLGASEVSAARLMEILYNGGEAAERQLIMYRTGENGEVTHIKLAADYSETPAYVGYNEAMFSKDYKGPRSSTGTYSEMAVNRESGLVDNRYYISDSTTFFRIPEPFDENKITCQVTAYNYANNGHNNSVIYDATPDRFAKVVVFNGSDAIDSEKMFIVEKVVKKLNSEGRVVRAIKGTYQNQEKEFIINEESDAMRNAKFELGDVLNLKLDFRQQVIDYDHMFALARRMNINASKLPKMYGGEFGYMPSGGSFTTPDSETRWLNSLLNFVHADVTKKNNSIIFVKAGSDDEFLVTPYGGAQYIYVVDAEKGTVRIGSYADINPYDPEQVIYMRLRYGSLSEAVIFNNFVAGDGEPVGPPLDEVNKKQYLKESFSQAERRLYYDYMTHNIDGTSYTSFEKWSLGTVGNWDIVNDPNQAGDKMLYIQQTTSTGYPTALLSSESLTAGAVSDYTLEFKFKIENHIQSAGALTRPIWFMNGTNALELINGKLYIAGVIESGGSGSAFIGDCPDNEWHTIQMSFSSAGTTVALDGVSKGTYNIKYASVSGATPQSTMARISDSGVAVPASGAYFGISAFAWAGSNNNREFDMYIDYVNIDFDGAPATESGSLIEGGGEIEEEEPVGPTPGEGDGTPAPTKASYLVDDFKDGAVVGGTYSNGTFEGTEIAEKWITHEEHTVTVIDDADEAGDKILKISQDGVASQRIHPATILTSSALEGVTTNDYTLEYRFKFDNYTAVPGGVADARPIWLLAGNNLIVLNGGKAYLNNATVSWGSGLTGTLIGDCAHGAWHTIRIRNYMDGSVFKTDVTLDGGATVTATGVRYGNLTGVAPQSNGYTHGADPAVTLKQDASAGTPCYFGVGNFVGGQSQGQTTSTWYRGFDFLLDYVNLTIND